MVIQCSNKIWDIHPIIPIIKAAGGAIFLLGITEMQLMLEIF